MLRRVRGLASVVLLLAACSPSPTPSDAGSAPPTGAIGGPSGRPTAPSAPPRTDGPPSTDPPPTEGPSPSAAASPVIGIVPGTVNRTSIELTATYDVVAAVTVASGGLEVATRIDVRNDSGDGIDRVELNTVAAKLGGMAITEASVDGVPVTATIDDQTIIVPLGGVLPDAGTAVVRIGYRATLRRGVTGSDWLFTRASGTLALYRWIPWVSRNLPFDRPNFGDPFMTASSPEVAVEILTDVPMVLAGPAAEISQVAAGEARAWSFTARDVRDVSVVLAPDYQLTEGEVDGVAIRVYTRPRGLNASRLRDLATQALDRQAELLGVPYPWGALTVVETEDGYGLESPGLIWIPDDVDSLNMSYLVHHEIAHQWFYGLVGNDQQGQPFADEAAADLLARTTLDTLRGSRCERDDLDRSITAYSQRCYYEVIYVQGGRLLDEIRAVMGTDRFWTAMGAYLVTHRHGFGSTVELLDTLRAASPVDLLPLLRQRFPSLY